MVFNAIHRIVAADRTMGYYRLLFSKPVSVSLFYAQRFAVHLAGLVVCVLILCVALRTGGTPVPIGSLTLYVVLLYVTMGGVGFLLSVITRYDWTLLIAVWYGAELLSTIARDHDAVWRPVTYVLPPVWLVDPVRDALLRGTLPAVDSLAWLLSYGVASFLLGLLLLERRPLSA